MEKAAARAHYFLMVATIAGWLGALWDGSVYSFVAGTFAWLASFKTHELAWPKAATR